jgi:hypothetical protein
MCEAKGTYCIFAASDEPEGQSCGMLESTETMRGFFVSCVTEGLESCLLVGSR